MDKKHEKEADIFLHKKGNPLCETACYQIGGTVYEVTTSCGGTERLYDKMVRLIKSETVTTSGDNDFTPFRNLFNDFLRGIPVKKFVPSSKQRATQESI